MEAAADSTRPRVFNPDNVRAPPTTYAHVAITPLVPSSKVVTLAGQVGVDAQTGHISASFTDQVSLAYSNVAKCLAAAHATPRDIIHVRHYIVEKSGNASLDRQDVFDRGWGPIWEQFMDREAGGHRPPDTVLGVASLAKKDLLYEVEVWAITHN